VAWRKRKHEMTTDPPEPRPSPPVRRLSGFVGAPNLPKVEPPSAPGESDDRPRFDLEGPWFAIWQTTAHGRPNFNTEVVTAQSRDNSTMHFANAAVSPENPDGGFLWSATLRLIEKSFLLGLYLPVEEGVTSKGTMFCRFHESDTHIHGIWAGKNIDSNVASGAFVFSRQRDKLRALIARYLRTTESHIRLG
jgi:hypothetical protein